VRSLLEVLTPKRSEPLAPLGLIKAEAKVHGSRLWDGQRATSTKSGAKPSAKIPVTLYKWCSTSASTDRRGSLTNPVFRSPHRRRGAA
jgi:hypothetical protein